MSKVWYGSVENRIQERTRSETPQLGSKVTKMMYSDKEPYTVTKIITPCQIEVTQNEVTNYCNNEIARITDNLIGKPILLRKNRNGQWKNEGTVFVIGIHEHYYDPCF